MAAYERSAWLRLLLALALVVPVHLLHLAAPRLTGTRGTLAGTVLAAAIAIVLGAAAYRGYVRAFERRAASEFATPGAPRELFAGFAVGAAYFAATIGILALLGVYRVVGHHDVGIVVAPLVSAMGTAVIEEILLRGIVFRIAENALGTWIALALSSLLFGLLHLVNPQATVQGAVAIIFEAGVLLGAAYVLTRRLWLPIGIHAGWNFTQGGIFGVAVSGHRSEGVFEGTLSGPEWLSGGDFGAEASIVAVVLGITLGMALIVMARRRGRWIQPYWRRDAGRRGPAEPQEKLV
ncbi:MAG: CPBP family intramembrane glutamic endopeptidase [Caldimonas sp.]